MDGWKEVRERHAGSKIVVGLVVCILLTMIIILRFSIYTGWTRCVWYTITRNKTKKYSLTRLISLNFTRNDKIRLGWCVARVYGGWGMIIVKSAYDFHKKKKRK